MSDFFYMRPLYTTEDGRPKAYSDQRGTVTVDPHAAFRRYRRNFELEWQADYGVCIADSRPGSMYAYWRFEQKPRLQDAIDHARSNPPYRVSVLVQPHGWRRVDFVLPDGEKVIFD